jgi:hypothetical protein
VPGAAAQAGTGGLNGIKGRHHFRDDFQHKLFCSRERARPMRSSLVGRVTPVRAALRDSIATAHRGTDSIFTQGKLSIAPQH